MRGSGEVRVKWYDTDMHANLLNSNYRSTQRLTGVTDTVVDTPRESCLSFQCPQQVLSPETQRRTRELNLELAIRQLPTTISQPFQSIVC